MKLAAVLLPVLLLAGCASVGPQTCPVGQARLRTAQLFFARQAPDQPRISDADFRRYVDQELTTRFPDGLTVLDGNRQWKGEENRLIRESAKIVLIVLPNAGDSQTRLTAAREAYKLRFKQDAILKVTAPACVSL